MIALFRCSLENKFSLAKHRSAVIAEIRDDREKRDSHVSASYCMLNSPTSDYDSVISCIASMKSAEVKFPFVTLYKCFTREPEERSVYVNMDVIPLKQLLGFDSYVQLKKSVLRKLRRY